MTNRVLVVDDDEVVRRLMVRILEKEGYEVREKNSADSLESDVECYDPDILFCDILLPGRDGLAVCRDLQANSRTRHVPVVLVSAKEFETDKRNAMNAGASGYLVKPVSAESLVRVAHETLSARVGVKIWGSRGSIAAPERATGRFGGNTACIGITLARAKHLILDAGTGIRALGNEIIKQSPAQISILLTHFHWDHIQGLPFFKPLYVPGNQIQIFGPAESGDALKDTLASQMGGSFFPVSIDGFQASVKYTAVSEQSFETLGVPVNGLYALHPGRTLMYKLILAGKTVVYAPDNEILPESVNPGISGEALRLARFAEGCDTLIHDCTYNLLKYRTRRGWGHSCPEYLAAVAAKAGVKRTVLFHHDPDSADEEVEAIHRDFITTLKERGADLEVEIGAEGDTVPL